MLNTMKLICTLLSIQALTSAYADDENYLYECYGIAISASKAIDALNFGPIHQKNIRVDAEVQGRKKARILVSFDGSKNREYRIRIRKNRSAALRGDRVSAEPGCYVESVN